MRCGMACRLADGGGRNEPAAQRIRLSVGQPPGRVRPRTVPMRLAHGLAGRATRPRPDDPRTA